MLITGRRRKIIFFIVLGICLVVLAVALNVSWIILHWRQGLLLFVGVLFFAAIILGLILNTGFLVSEIRLNEQHDSFINAVTHELKTPITSIRLYLETLQRRDVDEGQRQHFYKLMLDDTDRLRGTVDQVLKAGEVRFRRMAARNPVEVDFPVIVGECMELARTRHHLQPAALHWQDAAPPNGNGRGAAIKVHGDADELRTAIANILDNAIKYSGGRAQTHLQPLLPRAQKPLELPRKGNRPRPLHRSRHRARARRKGFCRKRRRSPRHHRHPRAAEERRVSRVLVVEDEAHLADGLRFNLEAEGHSVEVLGDGENAIGRLLGPGEKFDAVVLDVMLPGMDGFAVATALRKAKNYVPVLMLTARGRPEDVLAGFAAGTDDYLPKPFELPIFLARLQGLLRRSAWLTDQVSDHANEKPTAKATARAQRAGDKDKFSFDGRTIDFANLQLGGKDAPLH